MYLRDFEEELREEEKVLFDRVGDEQSIMASLGVVLYLEVLREVLGERQDHLWIRLNDARQRHIELQSRAGGQRRSHSATSLELLDSVRHDEGGEEELQRVVNQEDFREK